MVEHLLRFMYGVPLPTNLTGSELQRVFRMALSLGSSDCCSDFVDGICGMPPSRFSVEDALALRFSLPPAHAKTAQLHRACTAVLLHHLGDVVAVMRSEKLKAQWLALPLAALLELLRSPGLSTDSEDSVLAAVSVWVDAKAARAGAAQVVLQELRLLQLSAATYHTVLPRLPWVARCERLDATVHASLAAFASKGRRREELMPGLADSMPAAWTSTTARPASKTASRVRQGSYAEGRGSTKLFTFPRGELQEGLDVLTYLKRRGMSDMLPIDVPVFCLSKVLGEADEAQGEGEGWLFTHGLQLNAGMSFCARTDSVELCVRARWPSQLSNRGAGKPPSWHLRCELGFMLARKSSFRKVTLKDKRRPLDACVRTQRLFNFSRGQPVADMRSWKALLWQGQGVRLQLNVLARGPALLSAKRPPPRC